MITIHDKLFKGVKAARVDNSGRQPRQYELNAVLTHSVDALNILTIFALIANENLTPSADDFELVTFRISMQISRQFFSNKVHFFHLSGRLGNELFCWERTSLKTIVGLNVLYIGICDLTSVEIEVFGLLDFNRWNCI